jgi:phage terminase small subunit
MKKIAVNRFEKKDNLSVKEEKALCLYISNGNDIKKAFIDAGYRPSNAQRSGYNLLKTQKAKDFLALKVDVALKRYNKTADNVLEEAALIAFSDPANLFVKDEGGGIALKNIFEMGPGRRAIKKIKHTQRVTDIGGKDEDGNTNKLIENVYEYELWSKEAMIRLLAEHHKITEGGSGGGNTVIIPLLCIPDNGRNQD